MSSLSSLFFRFLKTPKAETIQISSIPTIAVSTGFKNSIILLDDAYWEALLPGISKIEPIRFPPECDAILAQIREREEHS